MSLLKTKKTKKVEVKKENATKTEIRVSEHALAKHVIRHPWISEKAQKLATQNQYIFFVDDSANKKMVKEEVEQKYNVHVSKLNMVRLPGKPKRYRNTIKETSNRKKAIVTLKDGEKIEII